MKVRVGHPAFGGPAMWEHELEIPDDAPAAELIRRGCAEGVNLMEDKPKTAEAAPKGPSVQEQAEQAESARQRRDEAADADRPNRPEDTGAHP